MMHPEHVEIKTVFLEKLRFALQSAFSFEALAQIDHDYMIQSMIARIEAHIWAHKERVETRDVPVTAYMPSYAAPEHVMMDITTGMPRWIQWLVKRLDRDHGMRWLPVVGKAKAGGADEIPIRGHAHVSATYFTTFPGSTIKFPDSLGVQIPLVQMSYPEDFTADPAGWWS